MLCSAQLGQVDEIRKERGGGFANDGEQDRMRVLSRWRFGSHSATAIAAPQAIAVLNYIARVKKQKKEAKACLLGKLYSHAQFRQLFSHICACL